MPVALIAALLSTTLVPTAVPVAGSSAGCAMEGGGPQPSASAALSDARQKFRQHDLAATRKSLNEALSTGLRPRECAEAHRLLALLHWRFGHDTENGRAHLEHALAAGVDRSESFAELARLEMAAKRFDAARAAAHRALQTARGENDSIGAVRRLAEIAIQRSAHLPWPDGQTASHLAEAHRHLTPLVRANPGLLEPARLQLTTALLLDDGTAALEAWMSYYASALGREGPLPEAQAVLGRVLPRWRGPATPRSERREVVLSLAASGMHDAARIVASDPRVAPELRIAAEPRIRELVAYADFLRRIENTVNEYYRHTALAERDTAADRQRLQDYIGEQFMAEAETLWPKLDWDGEPPPLDRKAAEEELERRFDAEFFFGRVGGFFDLHYGHRVIDERHTAEQYDHSAEVRFVALDGIVSNGFQTWAWDNKSGHGGWGNAEMIVQIRPRYAGNGLRAWQKLTDSATVAELRERVEEDAAADWERARGNPCAYLPGLGERISHQGRMALRDSLRAQGLEGDALRRAFLRAFEEVKLQSSIFAHEGRHAIDRTLAKEYEHPEDGEYWAKLSEVAFASAPRLAVGTSIISSNIGGQGRHGRANARIMCDLVDWMESHSTEIEGLDPSRPLLPQLDRLTDEQLRRAFRSLDPLAIAEAQS